MIVDVIELRDHLALQAPLKEISRNFKFLPLHCTVVAITFLLLKKKLNSMLTKHSLKQGKIYIFN